MNFSTQHHSLNTISAHIYHPQPYHDYNHISHYCAVEEELGSVTCTFQRVLPPQVLPIVSKVYSNFFFLLNCKCSYCYFHDSVAGEIKLIILPLWVKPDFCLPECQLRTLQSLFLKSESCQTPYTPLLSKTWRKVDPGPKTLLSIQSRTNTPDRPRKRDIVMVRSTHSHWVFLVSLRKPC
jgi:hypothetical protein